MGTRVPAMATLSSLALALTVGCRTDERSSAMIEVDSAGVRIVTSDPLGPTPSTRTRCARWAWSRPSWLVENWAAGVLASGASLNVRRSFGRFHDFRVPDTAYVEAYGTDGSLLDTVATLIGVQYTQVNPTSVQRQLFHPSPSVDARGTTVAIANGRDPEVRILGDDFRLRGIVRWADPDRTVTRTHVRALKGRVYRSPWRRSGGRGLDGLRRVQHERPAAGGGCLTCGFQCSSGLGRHRMGVALSQTGGAREGPGDGV